MVWPEAGVLAMAESQSLPTPKTQEPFRVVKSDAVGAPDEALFVPVAPIAPEPFVPVVSTPEKLITVREAENLWASVAVTVALLRVEAENARQISEVPSCALVLTTRVHVKPAPETLLTVIAEPEGPSAETNASNSSFPATVEKEGLAIVVPVAA